MHDNLNRFIVPNIAGPARIVPLASLADRNFSVAALRRAAQRGRLEAVQGPDGIWRSSRRAGSSGAAEPLRRSTDGAGGHRSGPMQVGVHGSPEGVLLKSCLLYTSDAADE